MRVDLFSVFGTDTLRDRQTARLLVAKLAKLPQNNPVVIDFAKITFASRSFCHELLTGLKNTGNIKIENQNEEVTQMMTIASTKPDFNHELSVKTISLC